MASNNFVTKVSYSIIYIIVSAPFPLNIAQTDIGRWMTMSKANISKRSING